MMPTQYDLIVVGAGAAGLTAATTAAVQGARVLLIEATEKVGGTTAISGGMIWIPDNHKMREAHLPDSAAEVHRYVEATVPGAAQDARMQAYLRLGDTAIRFLESNTALRLQPVRRYPDYYPTLPGATEGGRVLEPVPFDGRALGEDFALLRDPLPEFMLFGGMMISREDIPKLRRVTTSAAAACHVAKLMLRYGRQRLHAHRGTSLVLGNALAARLFKAARDAGVDIALSTELVDLTFDAARVTGVRIKHRAAHGAASPQENVAASAVILASGGISHDAVLRAAFVPPLAGDRSATADAHAATGGVRVARDVGAAISSARNGVDDALAFWVPVSRWQRDDGTTAYFPHTVTDRAKPGLIAVNARGERFTNEARSYHEFVRAQLRPENDAATAWLVCDRRFLWKYGIGRIRPFTWNTRADIESGYLKTGATPGALAQAIGVPEAALEHTVAQYNLDAEKGLDRQFGRGGDRYQRHLGDADHTPDPCNAPIVDGPFYAVAVYPADLGMSAGLMTDENARVLTVQGEPIEGLYACGNDMHSIMNGAYPGPGITLGPALVFGVIAAHHALGRPFAIHKSDV